MKLIENGIPMVKTKEILNYVPSGADLIEIRDECLEKAQTQREWARKRNSQAEENLAAIYEEYAHDIQEALDMKIDKSKPYSALEINGRRRSAYLAALSLLNTIY